MSSWRDSSSTKTSIANASAARAPRKPATCSRAALTTNSSPRIVMDCSTGTEAWPDHSRVSSASTVATPRNPNNPATAMLTNRVSSHTDRKSTRLNSCHTVIYTLSLHDALPICVARPLASQLGVDRRHTEEPKQPGDRHAHQQGLQPHRSEEHTSELLSHSDLHSFPTRRSSDLRGPTTRESARRRPSPHRGTQTTRRPPCSPTGSPAT